MAIERRDEAAGYFLEIHTMLPSTDYC